MYKLILSDLDETLIVNHRIPQINQEAIHNLPSNVKFVVATGRTFNLVQDILEDAKTKNKENEYSICLNGACILENTGKKIYFKGLDYEIVHNIFNDLKDRDGCLSCVQDGCYYMFHASEYEANRKKIQKAHFKVCDDINDFEKLLKDKVFDKFMYCSKDFEEAEEVCAYLNSKYSDLASITISSSRYVEVNSLGVNKGKALAFLADYLGVKVEETIAIGDNLNDTSMIEAAGLGVCVGDGQPAVKDIADYVCKKGFAEGAVKEVIDTFIMNEVKQ